MIESGKYEIILIELPNLTRNQICDASTQLSRFECTFEIFENMKKLDEYTVGKPRTDSVPPTMQSQTPKSRDVTLFFFRHDVLQVSGHALFTSTPHVFLLNIFINKTERRIHFY